MKTNEEFEKWIETIWEYCSIDNEAIEDCSAKRLKEFKKYIVGQLSQSNVGTDRFACLIRVAVTISTQVEKRFREAEKYILQTFNELSIDGGDASDIGDYACFHFGQKGWPELEEILLKDGRATYCYGYAFSVLEGRFRAAEPIIMKSQYTANDYVDQFQLSEDVEFVSSLKGEALVDFAVDYVEAHQGRWKQMEPAIKRLSVWHQRAYLNAVHEAERKAEEQKRIDAEKKQYEELVRSEVKAGWERIG